jgi:hypothetical protein
MGVFGAAVVATYVDTHTEEREQISLKSYSTEGVGHWEEENTENTPTGRLKWEGGEKEEKNKQFIEIFAYYGMEMLGR